MTNFANPRRAVCTVSTLFLFVAFTGNAHAGFNYAVGNYAATGLANNSGDFDKLTLTGRSGTLSLAPGDSTTITFSDLVFEVGSGANGTFQYSTSQTLTIDGFTQTIVQPYSVTSSTSDSLVIQNGATLQFAVTGGTLSFTPLTYSSLSHPIGTFPGVLQAQVSFSATAVPEPSSLALCGLAAILCWGVSRVRRRDQPTA